MATQKGPGKGYRTGISLAELFRMFPDDETSRHWFELARWDGEPWCPRCGSTNVQSGAKHKTMPYRCRAKGCAKRFSARIGTPLEESKLGYQTWAIAIYLLTTGLKGVSSMKLPPRSRHHAKERMAPGPPHPRDVGRRPRRVPRPRGSRRDGGGRERA